MLLKIRRLSVVCLLMLLSSAQVQAGFCENPMATVCQNSEKIREERSRVLNNLKEEIRVEANRRASEIITERDASRRNEGGVRGFLRRISDWSENYLIKNREIFKSAKARIAGFEENLVSDEVVTLVKGMLKRSIDESSFPSDTKNKFKNVVDETVVGNFADYVERSGVQSNILSSLFSNHCGTDGLVTNAFATRLGNKPYVLICPGWLISISTLESEYEKMSVILQVLSHELAHHIDARDYSADYETFSQCYSQHLVDEMNKTSADQAFCEQHPEDCNAQVMKSHSGEIVADHWATKVMAIYINDNALSSAIGEEVITGSMQKLCTSRDEGIHPSGEFRISHIMGQSPEVREALSCGESEVCHAVCDWDGLVSAPSRD